MENVICDETQELVWSKTSTHTQEKKDYIFALSVNIKLIPIFLRIYNVSFIYFYGFTHLLQGLDQRADIKLGQEVFPWHFLLFWFQKAFRHSQGKSLLVQSLGHFVAKRFLVFLILLNEWTSHKYPCEDFLNQVRTQDYLISI